MSHKIAIITTADVYDQYGDDYNAIINSITDWAEVSDEDFALLQKAQYTSTRRYQIIERPTDIDAFICKTVEDYKILAKKEEEKRKKEEEQRAAAALDRKAKKLANDKKSKLALLKKLQEELKDEIQTNM